MRGLRLSYLEWGVPVSGRPSLLILHGLLAAAETFDNVVNGLEPGLHVIALDMPGNGHSERNRALDVSTGSLAEILFEFVEQRGLVRPVVLGHSHGGLLALRLAATHRELLSGLVLIAPAHPFEGYRESMVRFYMRPFGKNAARLIFPRIPAWLYLFFFRQMPGTRDHFGREHLEPYLHSLRMPGTVPYTLKVLETWHDDMAVLRADLEREPMALPTLVMWGGKDEVVPASSGAALLEHFSAAELVLMEKAGHLPNEEAPVECAEIVGRWLAAVFPVAERVLVGR